jgi:acetyltransferase-like isoleucine patch superfamily enzyme
MLILNKRYIQVGRGVLIRDGARIEAYLFDCNNKMPSIKIEDNVSIEQRSHIISGGGLVIGKNTTISANVFISNIDHSYSQKSMHILKQDKVIKQTRISENCFIGYGACILPGSILGKQCIVGANSVVKGIFPDYSVLAGNPAKIIKSF